MVLAKNKETYSFGYSKDGRLGKRYISFSNLPKKSKWKCSDVSCGDDYTLTVYGQRILGFGSPKNYGLSEKDNVRHPKEVYLLPSNGEVYASFSNSYIVTGNRILSCGTGNGAGLMSGKKNDSPKFFPVDVKVLDSEPFYEQEKIERISYSVEEANVLIKLSNKELKYARIIDTSNKVGSSKTDIIDLSNKKFKNKFDIHRDSFVLLFYGIVPDKIDEIYELYKFCSEFSLKKFEYVLLHSISKKFELEKILEIFSFSFKELDEKAFKQITEVSFHYSQENENEDTTKSPEINSNFNIFLLNIFKSEFDAQMSKLATKKKSKINRKFLGLVNEILETYEIKDFLHFEDCKDRCPKRLFINHKKSLINEIENTSNFEIISKDKGSIQCHKEILIVESDYFYKVIKFKGVEMRERGKLILSTLNKRSLEIFVEYLYTSSLDGVSKVDIVPLFDLLVELQPYSEGDMCEEIESKLLFLTGNLVREKEFYENFELIWRYLEMMYLSKELKSRFIEYWCSLSSDVDETEIKILLNTLRTSEVKDRQTVMHEGMNEVLKKIEDSFLQLDSDIEGVKKNDNPNEITKIQEDRKEGNQRIEKMLEDLTGEIRELSSRMKVMEEAQKRKRKSEDTEERVMKKRRIWERLPFVGKFFKTQ